MKVRKNGFGYAFDVNERVSFEVGTLKGKGTVLGLAFDHIVQQYIVLLDEPLETHRAILVQNTLMKLI